jgi:hypothetical protein
MREKKEKQLNILNRNQVASLKILKVINFLELQEQQVFRPKFLFSHLDSSQSFFVQLAFSQIDAFFSQPEIQDFSCREFAVHR